MKNDFDKQAAINSYSNQLFIIMHLYLQIKSLRICFEESFLSMHSHHALLLLLFMFLAAVFVSTNLIILQNTKAQPSTTVTAKDSDFSTYVNPSFGMRIQYPKNWTLQEIGNTSAANNTIAIFRSTSKTSSQLGNISGVSGNFVPYLDIFTFDSKNSSLQKIVNGIINHLHNSSGFVLEQSKPFTLNKNTPAYLLTFGITVGGDEHFKKTQVYALAANKVYLITFTSQQATFSDYMPVVQKMINSFQINNNKKD